MWITAELHFALTYSYRMPDASPSFAVCSPVPSPAAIRLALVDAVIRHTGKVDEGARLFEMIRNAVVEVEPPERVAIFRVFLKRLKPEKPEKGKTTTVLESTGIREYCVPDGPMYVSIDVEEPAVELVQKAFCWLRRLGTTDSLLSVRLVDREPRREFCARRVKEVRLEPGVLVGRLVYTLHELKPRVKFEAVNPFSGAGGSPFIKVQYLLPLVRDRMGENWVLYEKKPLPLAGNG